MANARNSASGRDGRRHNVPPEHGKIRAKEVRNPWGRAGKPSPQPPTAIDDLLWLEANRIVSHDSNGPVDAKKRLIQEEFFAALQGGDSSVRARLLAQLQDSGKRIEEQSQEIRDFFLKGKALLTEQFYLAQRTGRAPPDVLPHPDHVSILGGEILFHGPTDLRGRLAWETIKSAIRITACIHQVTKEEFRRTADPLALEQLILSQRHEGWTLVPSRYDDGGFSGGSMLRPGLKSLLADIEVGLVDVIVVYKVDRLTRSLADFAKIVEQLDAKQASFVSVTQAFNTTTSMGRLTLNVLLSFAQFEREVTGERIRDKIAASKKKGMWMGGPVPLGYAVIDRKLVPVPEEAERVRTIMRRYLEIRSVPALIEVLRREGIITKVQQRTSGPHRGGIPFERGSLFHLLKNPIYRGKIVHKDKVYDGEHEPIVEEGLWDAVQAQLAAKAPARKRPKNDPQQAMLSGLLADPQGRPMVSTYATKRSRRYAYYETRKDLARPGDQPATRFGQGQLERHVLERIEALLNDEHELRRIGQIEDGARLRLLIEGAQGFISMLRCSPYNHDGVRILITKIKVQSDHLELALNPGALGLDGQSNWSWNIPLPSRKPFREAKMRIDAEAPGRTINGDLLDLLVEAKSAQELVLANPDLSLNQLGKSENRCRTHLARLLRISWLSPRIFEAIAVGAQPSKLNRQVLLSNTIPLDWSEQERQFGLTA